MNPIVLAILLVSGIGLVAGAGLAIASVLMAVPVDEKAEAIEAALPGANCGACGFSGCSGYAAALAKGEAQPGLCAPGGKDAAVAIAAILGTEAVDVQPKTAVVRCMGTCERTSDRMEYDGIRTCAAAVQMFRGPGSCSYGCIGFGDCAAVCPEGAISVCNGIAHVDPDKCIACGKCAKACPKQLIAIVPNDAIAMVRCSNKDKGAITRKVCTAGCIGCMKCQKNCEAGAIKVVNNLASVDPAKCTGCGKCESVCPQHCIVPVRPFEK
ncbi:MAG: RnfABCDGE type electron transport complex subunit B [Clostridia bacterium]|nr:RnfABCDGE type electron transport complex subunit B [Clostridia bacterium]